MFSKKTYMIDFAKYSYGFGLTETLVAIFLTAVISSAFFLGITQTKLYLDSIRIKQTAFRELSNWTNQWKGLVAAGVESFPSDPSGEPVVLKQDSQGNTTLQGKMYKRITKANESGNLSTYYNVDTYIIWNKKRFFLSTAIENQMDTIRFNTYQVRFNTK